MGSRPGPRDQARESARARRATEAELFKELEVLISLSLSFCLFLAIHLKGLELEVLQILLYVINHWNKLCKFE